jgi:small subunit ribosomal protein S27e
MVKSMKELRVTKSKFIRVRCPKCNAEQVIFGKATTEVRCLKCDYLLTNPAAGKAKIKAKVLEVFK